MSKFSFKREFIDSERNVSLEIRLLRFFILVQEIWALFNLIMGVLFRLPAPTIKMYGVFAIFLPAYFALGYYSKHENIFIRLYFVISLIANPIVWHFAGGDNASANVMFILQIIAFVMCLKGRRQIIYIVLSMLSTSMVAIVKNLPFYHPIAMSQEQIVAASRNLGISTCLLVAALLIKQKKEYAKERDIAIKSEQELERSNKMQKNFLANMSHEIRSPLGIVLGFNGLIAESNDIKQIHEYSANIENAGKTLHTVINDILDYSKIESGKLDIIDSDYSFEELISEVKNDIGLKCAEKGLAFEVEEVDGIPRYLYGDNIRIKQCLLNILSNAVKYTERGFVKFLITKEDSKEDGRIGIRFDVIDSGRGIAEKTIPNLFSAFQRLDEGQNRGIEGTGLGLAITKNLLDEMGGTIEVHSVYKEGSTFTIRIEQQVSEKVQVASTSVNDIDISGLKVLAVDDTKLNLSLIHKLLIKQDVLVKTIASGRECLEDCAKNQYDVILLDHMMPEMDGVEVFKRLRSEDGPNKNTPVIMLTANAMAGASKEYENLGFDGYVSKPIAPPLLNEAIYNVVNG